MNISDLFVRKPEPRCARCEGRSGHPVIAGEGAPICMPCILRNGRAAADPSRLTAGEAQMLAAAHGDVVRLVRMSVPTGTYWRWWWTSSWPSGPELAK